MIQISASLLLLVLVMFPQKAHSQELARFKVVFDNDLKSNIISVPVDGLNYNTDEGELVLYEITSKGERLIPGQLETGHTARYWFLQDGKIKRNTEKIFVLKQEEIQTSNEKVILKKDHKDLSFQIDEKPVLSYRHAITYPPENIDPLFKRSAYIHPLFSPGGELLTRIQPADHYHHYGIWGPWTKTHINDREVDFWNLKKGQGTVEFASFLSETEGEVYSGFKALQQHIDFGAKGPDQVAMNEILDVRVWNIPDEVYIIDYTTSINSPLENGIMLDAYRYGGGIGFRATEKWHKDNCTVLTSEGRTRTDADGSPARWCIVEGESEVEEGRSGILFMSHPSNRMHPEPMRVWPADGNNGRGDIFFEFTPIRHEDWKLEPDQNYTLKYRMVVFDGEMDVETAEMYWNSFAKNPVIEFLD